MATNNSLFRDNFTVDQPITTSWADQTEEHQLQQQVSVPPETFTKLPPTAAVPFTPTPDAHPHRPHHLRPRTVGDPHTPNTNPPSPNFHDSRRHQGVAGSGFTTPLTPFSRRGSGQGGVYSRRGSAADKSRRGSEHRGIHGERGLQCHYRQCEWRGGTSEEWREHIVHCRRRNWLPSPSGYQCSFSGCPSELSFPTLQDVLRHEKMQHELQVCTGCLTVWRVSDGIPLIVKQQHELCAPTVAPFDRRPSQAELLRRGINHLFTRDPGSLFHSSDNIRRTLFLDLSYSERDNDRTKPQNQFVGLGLEDFLTSPPGTSSQLGEPARTAMVGHIQNSLRLLEDLVRGSSEVALELRPDERDSMRATLVGLGRLFRIELDEGVNKLTSEIQAIGTPKIEIESAERSSFSTVNNTGSTGRRPSRLFIPNSPLSPHDDLNPSAPQTPNQNFHPNAILKALPSMEVIKQIATTAVETVAAIQSVSPNPDDDGPPLPQHISAEDQRKYYEMMNDHCLSATQDWFKKHQVDLLKLCECTLSVPPNASPSHGSTAAGTTRQPPRKRQPAYPTPNNSASSSNTSTHPTKRSVCFLHNEALAKPHQTHLQKWTHALRRYHECGRIPPGLLKNPDSFRGEIRMVDEVRHSVTKGKIKNDRDLLALVSIARTYCRQLRDWDRCDQLDDLYKLVEEKVAWEKKEKRMAVKKQEVIGVEEIERALETSVTVVEEKTEEEEKWSTVERRRRSRLKNGVSARSIGHSFTWPRSLDF